MTQNIFKEAKRFHDLGWAVLWLRRGSKAPTRKGWTTGDRYSWDDLQGEYSEGLGLGVRLGQASKIEGGYLASFDIDIKSGDKKHKKEALAFIESSFPGLLKQAPVVVTGYGFRLFIKTPKPVKSRKLASSDEKTKVMMKTAPISREQTQAVKEGHLSDEELRQGYRVRVAWEVELMSEGKQVVLPPSIHPDTNKPYRWGKRGPVTTETTIPMVVITDYGNAVGQNPRLSKVLKRVNTHSGDLPRKFSFVTPDYLDSRFSDKIVKMIHGEDVTDRSSACFAVSIAMVKAGFSDDEIISVLTDQDTVLGETAFEHRGTDNRDNAAQWAYEYCLKKVKEEFSAASVFGSAVGVEEVALSDEASEKQTKALVKEKPWQERLTRTGQNGDGSIKPTLGNIRLILINAVSSKIFERDTFSFRDAYGCDAPWTGGIKRNAITDDDAVNIKTWLSNKYRFEPSIGTIFEAITSIATENSYHPVEKELETLPAWDGKPRIDTWLKKYFEAEGDDEYLAQVFRKWLVASITRTFKPGAKFDWMPIFEGAQGTGKSSFGSILFGQSYFSDWLPNLADKDAALGLLGKRCIEFAELDRMRRNEVDTVKAFVTRQIDNVRPPYGRKAVELPRGVVFFGSTNRKEYLQDDTGNRRFNPVKVGRLNFKVLARDRDQLWAEALAIYESGLEETLELSGDAHHHAIKKQKEKMVKDNSDIMAFQLDEFFTSQAKAVEPKNRFGVERFRVETLFKDMGPLRGDWKLGDRNIVFGGRAMMHLFRKYKDNPKSHFKVISTMGGGISFYKIEYIQK